MRGGALATGSEPVDANACATARLGAAATGVLRAGIAGPPAAAGGLAGVVFTPVEGGARVTSVLEALAVSVGFAADAGDDDGDGLAAMLGAEVALVSGFGLKDGLAVVVVGGLAGVVLTPVEGGARVTSVLEALAVRVDGAGFAADAGDDDGDGLAAMLGAEVALVSGFGLKDGLAVVALGAVGAAGGREKSGLEAGDASGVGFVVADGEARGFAALALGDAAAAAGGRCSSALDAAFGGGLEKSGLLVEVVLDEALAVRWIMVVRVRQRRQRSDEANARMREQATIRSCSLARFPV